MLNPLDLDLGVRPVEVEDYGAGRVVCVTRRRTYVLIQATVAAESAVLDVHYHDDDRTERYPFPHSIRHVYASPDDSRIVLIGSRQTTDFYYGTLKEMTRYENCLITIFSWFEDSRTFCFSAATGEPRNDFRLQIWKEGEGEVISSLDVAPDLTKIVWCWDQENVRPIVPIVRPFIDLVVLPEQSVAAAYTMTPVVLVWSRKGELMHRLEMRGAVRGILRLTDGLLITSDLGEEQTGLDLFDQEFLKLELAPLPRQTHQPFANIRWNVHLVSEAVVDLVTDTLYTYLSRVSEALRAVEASRKRSALKTFLLHDGKARDILEIEALNKIRASTYHTKVPAIDHAIKCMLVRIIDRYLLLDERTLSLYERMDEGVSYDEAQLSELKAISEVGYASQTSDFVEPIPVPTRRPTEVDTIYTTSRLTNGNRFITIGASGHGVQTMWELGKTATGYELLVVGKFNTEKPADVWVGRRLARFDQPVTYLLGDKTPYALFTKNILAVDGLKGMLADYLNPAKRSR